MNLPEIKTTSFSAQKTRPVDPDRINAWRDRLKGTIKKVEKVCYNGEDDEKNLNDIIELTTKLDIWLKHKTDVKLKTKTRRKHIPIEKIMRKTKKDKRKQFSKPLPDRRCHNFHAINLMINQTEDDPAWADFFAAMPQSDIDEFIGCWSEEDQIQLRELIEAARENWMCQYCLDFNIDNVNGGYIDCDECERQFHKTCAHIEVEYNFLIHKI